MQSTPLVEHGRSSAWASGVEKLVHQCPDRVSAGQRLEAEELACRPGSVPGGLAADRGATIHLGPPLPVASCGLPTYSGGQPSDVRAPVTLAFSAEAAGFLTLLRAGFAEPAGSPRSLVVSCTTVSPLPALSGTRPCPGRRSVLCGTFPRVTPGGCCPPPCPAEPGPSSTPVSRRTPRSPGQLLRTRQRSRAAGPDRPREAVGPGVSGWWTQLRFSAVSSMTNDVCSEESSVPVKLAVTVWGRRRTTR